MVPSTPTVPATVMTPVMVANTPIVENSLPRRFISRLMRNKDGGKRFTTGGVTFMEALSNSMQKARLGLIEYRNMEKGESSMGSCSLWNIRGLNNPTKQLEIKRFLSQNKVGICGLLETKSKFKNWNKVRVNLCDDWSICTNSSLHKGRRIWLIWDPNAFEVEVYDVTVQSIHTKVLDKARRKLFWFTVVYGLNKQAERIPLWDSLRHYCNNVRGPWLVGGDFNAIMAINEIIGGAIITQAEMAPLAQVVQDCQLEDLGARGSFYTWTNKHEYCTKVYSRLDRVMVNVEWVDMFPDSYVHYLPEGLFDHCPEWTGTPMFRIVQKLKGLKADLRKLNKKHFGDIENLTHVTEIALLQFQSQLIQDPLNEELCMSERECAKDLAELKIARDQYLRQKAKCDWMKSGDDNTAYFHAQIKRRRARNRVFQIKDMNQNMCSNPDAIQAAFEQYYKILLGTSKELVKAIYAIPGTKAPGPDRYTSQFFKDNWEIVGPDVVTAVKGVFQSGQLLKQCNNTIITLIPKVEIPDSVLQFRPIAYWDRASITLLLKAFDYFSKASGLTMNKGKSNFYCNGIDELLVKEIEQNSGIKRGTVPFMYLGVNVSPKRPSILDCTCLVERVVDRIRSLGSRKLSYAGRIVLIKAVLTTLHRYWGRIFILPKTVIGRIEAVCRAYLWHGTDQNESPALVSWEQVRKPKKQGGLGFKDLHLWNVASISKYAWWVTQKKYHLWVRWVHAVYIKQSDWMTYKPGVGSSWAMRKICQVKEIFKDHFSEGNGLEHFTVSKGYQWLKPDGVKVNWYPWVLNRWILPKHSFLCWLVAHQRLLTQDSKQCVQLLSIWCNIKLPDTECIQWLIRLRQSSACRKMVTAVILACLTYQLWQMRNTSRIEGFIWRPKVLVDRVKHKVKLRLRQCDIKSRNANVLEWLEHIQMV
ncbi:uncharacterized protein LOC141651673 [Silene latifolia]|uniref:uncharacterized protein LOC141651673 n=1 Tax=Silene latifolia TaxID=37657 RepID=UPI003D7893A0